MTIVMIPLARREMLRAARWYDNRGTGLGDQFLDDMRSSLIAIRALPGAFPPLDATFRRKLLDVFPYGIVCRVDVDTITRIAVVHVKRRPGYWRRRQ